MEIRTSLTVRRPRMPRPLLAIGLALFVAFAYGPSASWLVLARSPAMIELACGPGRAADLVAPSLVDPRETRSRPLRFACRDAGRRRGRSGGA